MVQFTLELLLKLLSRENTMEIGTIAVKTFLLELPAKEQPIQLWKVCFDELVNYLNNVKDLDAIDILATCLNKFGVEFALLNDVSMEKFMLHSLLDMLESNRGVIRKRSIQALGSLARILDDGLFTSLLNQSISGLAAKKNEADYEKLQSFLLLLATLANANPQKLKAVIESLKNDIIAYCSIDHDEIREQCLLVRIGLTKVFTNFCRSRII
jgi:hypothetical protein